MKQPIFDEISHFALLDDHPDPTLFYIPVFDTVRSDTLIDFELVYGNMAAAQGIGVEMSALKGQRVLSINWADEETRNVLFQSLFKVYQGGESTETIYYNPVLDRHYKTFRRRVADGVLTIARDVTAEFMERVEKERQLALSNLILNTSLNGWFACECVRDEKGALVDFVITRINPNFSRMTGYTEKEVIGKSYLSLFPASRSNGTFELNCGVVDTGQPARKQISYKGDNIDGWYDVAVAVLGKNGILVTFDDISETKRNALAAEQSARTLQTVFEAAQTGMFTFEPEYNEKGEIIDFRFVMVNSAISEYTGKKADALVGELGTKWFDGYLANGEFDLYKRCFETGEPQQREIHYCLDGRDVYLYLQSTKIGGQLLVTLIDYSLLRQSQHQLEQNINALKRSNQNLEEFAHAASHDLKEPIRKIAVFAERLENGLASRLTDNERDMFKRMRKATGRMTLLIDDLLTYSHMSLTIVDKEDVDLGAKLRVILSDLEVVVEEKNGVIQVDSLPVVKGYKRQLQQVFQNLVSNALKYSRPGEAPHIHVRSRMVAGDEAKTILPPEKWGNQFHLIEVEDNGIGFEQQYAERIFHMFTRLHGNSEYAGTGVGLAIVRKVIENHQGYIWATGEPGKGATFSVMLPA